MIEKEIENQLKPQIFRSQNNKNILYTRSPTSQINRGSDSGNVHQSNSIAIYMYHNYEKCYNINQSQAMYEI
jgi:hypothetical protein